MYDMKRTRRFWAGYFIMVILLAASFITAYNLFTGRGFGMTENSANETKGEERIVKLPNEVAPSPEDNPEPTVIKDCLPSRFQFHRELQHGNQILTSFRRDYNLIFSSPDSYATVEGITSFRGNNYRDTASYGFADITEKKLEKAWSVRNGYIDVWTGVGWNGQPSIIKWDEALKNKMNITAQKKKKKDLKEVIYATLDGNIYFLDLDDGRATRSPIRIGAPHKGSVTVDPRGYPLLYAGQGIHEVGGKNVEIGYRIFSLINQKKLYFINGFDKYALRRWGAFDSTGLIDRKTDSLVVCGENGILYSAKLNTRYDAAKGSISIQPDLIKYRYLSPKKGTLGTENSVAIYRNYAYFADNSGTLQCVDLNTLSPVWIRDVTDDTDSTIALEENGEYDISLYTACEMDKQGAGGSSYIRKINALTGELQWEKAVKCYYDSHTNGGALASPVVGKNDISDLVIYNIAKTDTIGNGKLLALDKKTGQEVWTINLKHYSWSSPVAVYTKEGKSYLIVCDSIGSMYLLEGKTGKLLHQINLEANIEGSPAVYDNMIVVGTRGQKIWGVRIK
jgi:outer membrane protein assembly factor BamB